MTRGGLAALIVVVLLPGLLGAANSDMALAPPQEPIPPSYFDLNIIFNPHNNVPWPSVPFYGWRLSHANWFELEPRKGQWEFDHLDQLVSWAQQHNSEILMPLEYCPQWASSNPDARGDWVPGASGPLRNIDDWRDFVRTVATRYKGRIHAYEIWNEPDRPKAWTGDVNMMVLMVLEASKILKQIDPTITVVSPSATTEKGLAWLREFLSKGGGQYVDVIGYHFYSTPKPPEAMVPIIQNAKALMAEHHVGDKPLWNTEAGWHEPRPFPSQEMAAAYLARAYILNWAAGVSRFYWYCWDNHDWTSLEVTEADNAALRPAGKAFAVIQKWMTGTTMRHCWASENKNWVCQIDRGGKPEYIVWNEQGDRSFRLSHDWHVGRLTKLSGDASSIRGDTIPIGIQPVLIQ